MSGMETYHGHVRSPTDAIILFEACRIGLLPRVQRRLSEKERQSIKSGSVFVWDEREAGMRRWTDGKSWSASRVSGSFLTYREMEGKRGGSGFDKSANRDGVQGNDGDSDGGPDGYRYKPDGLMKQSFSITTNDGHHLHLISYYSRQALTANNLMLPSSDPQLRHIRPEKGMYPESTVHEQSSIPAVTRGPMGSPGYTHSPNQPPYQRTPSYGYPPHPAWAPPSPMHTPPPYPQYGPYFHHPYAHHGAYPGSMHYPPPPHHPYAQHGAPPMTAYDRPPPPIGSSGLPPPGHHAYPPPPYHGAYPPHYAHGQPPHYPPQPPTSYDARPPATETATSASEARPAEPPRPAEPRTEPAKTSVSPPRAPEKTVPSPPSQSTAPGSSGQTIPSISAMLNGGENGQPPARKQSRSPNGTPPRPLQDIPSHKLGFEANRDMHTLRNLDKSTFKF